MLCLAPAAVVGFTYAFNDPKTRRDAGYTNSADSSFAAGVLFCYIECPQTAILSTFVDHSDDPVQALVMHT